MRTRRLNTGHIRIQGINRINNLIELRVAQVGVNLSFILDRTRR